MAPALSCLAYSLCSISMVLANKMIVSAESFNHPFTLCLLQNSVSFFVVLFAQAGGIVEADPIKLPVAKMWLPVTLIFTCMLLTSFLRCVPISPRLGFSCAAAGRVDTWPRGLAAWRRHGPQVTDGARCAALDSFRSPW